MSESPLSAESAHPQGDPAGTPRQTLRSALEHACHLLPSQAPLDRFVHHNPLHAFEHLPFDEAVVQAARAFGNDPFLPEADYRDAFAHGRIHAQDLTEILHREVAEGPVAGLVGRHALTRALLLYPIEPLGRERLAWWLTETDALTVPRADLSPEARGALLAETGGDAERALRRLWAVCEGLRAALPAPPEDPAASRVRVREELLHRRGVDLDALVHPVLIRWCAAYLDQGVAQWAMAGREQGFYACFLRYFAQERGWMRPWMDPLGPWLRQAQAERWGALELCERALRALGHPERDWPEVVTRSLLALKGWTGMFKRLAERPDLVPERRLPTAVEDVLAVRLSLELAAARWVLPEGEGSPLDRVLRLPLPAAVTVAPPDPAWTLFELAQILGLGPHTLEQTSTPRLVVLLEEVQALGDVARRRLWHLAYERRHRVQVLEAVSVHARRVARRPAPAPRAQVVLCIDDREESMRRHLEELAPWVETFGVAGNFGVSMYFDGVEFGRPVALGPAGAEPRHLVVERALGARSRPDRVRGLLTHHIDLASTTMTRGALVALGGLTASVPMTLRVLAPKLHARLTRGIHPGETELELDRVDPNPDASGLLRGFTLDEKCSIVGDTLRAMGLVRGFTPLVFCLGHGAASLNNPHLAGYNCGACGGGRGGPNARVFTRLANDLAVRERLRAQGLDIPAGTWFVGGMHNTTSDAVELYDLPAVPPQHAALLAEVQAALGQARALNAQERCRKFLSAPLDLSPAQALDHVEVRAEDLAQPRPEYGHNTNAVALVGRRAWSRGLFLDRRAFLVSYDPSADPDGEVLPRLLDMALVVGAGINLEYWFSVVDPTRYGAGTKLPHNLTGLIGVMDGHASDLRTGLPWQMVEIHEPVRLLCVVEASPAALLRVAERNPAVGRLITQGWVQVASLDPATGAMQRYMDGAFRPWRPEQERLPVVERSVDWFGQARGLLPPASVLPGRGVA